MWDQAKNEWIKLCKKSVKPKIEIDKKDERVMISIKDDNSEKIKHALPNKDSALFKVDEKKLSCQWMTNKDIIQNQAITVHIFFKTQTNYQQFVDIFLRLQCAQIDV